MQETAKVNYVQYGKGSKKAKSKSSGSKSSVNNSGSGNSGSTGNSPKSGGKGKKVQTPDRHLLEIWEGRHQKGKPCKAVEAVCRHCSTKGHYEKVCMKRKHSTHLVNVPEASTSSEPDYINEYGNPVYAHMVDVKEINHKKHLILFLISTDLEKVRNSVKSSTKCSTVLLKSDTGADVNLMNSKTFDSIFQDRTVLQPSSLRMEAYRNNTAVEVLGRFHAFLRWKGKV